MDVLGNIFLVSAAANIFLWAIFGLLVGVISYVFSSKRSSLAANLISSTLGAVLGGFMASILFGVTISGFDLSSLALAMGSSILTLYLTHALVYKKVERR
jgi:uncharacterized membrane protein YeaQ/YmgE (transglycosylase-associated protein family)